jgi:hypothetical protein
MSKEKVEEDLIIKFFILVFVDFFSPIRFYKIIIQTTFSSKDSFNT